MEYCEAGDLYVRVTSGDNISDQQVCSTCYILLFQTLDMLRDSIFYQGWTMLGKDVMILPEFESH